MVIEQLSFTVPPDLFARFADLDRQIWTATLARQPGFLGKEIWRDVARPEHVRIVIRWASRREWKAVPQVLLAATDRAFATALGVQCPVERCDDMDVIG